MSMGLFDFFTSEDINAKLQEARAVEGAVLLDVRNADEFRQGHIPGSVNVPVDCIEKAADVIAAKDTPVYAYCLRGSRSKRAVAALKAMGYTNVCSIGGINRYKGEIE